MTKAASDQKAVLLTSPFSPPEFSFNRLYSCTWVPVLDIQPLERVSFDAWQHPQLRSSLPLGVCQALTPTPHCPQRLWAPGLSHRGFPPTYKFQFNHGPYLWWWSCNVLAANVFTSTAIWHDHPPFAAETWACHSSFPLPPLPSPFLHLHFK